MKPTAVLAGMAFTLGAFVTLSVPAQAANARHPHTNVDKRLDKGGDTGDRQVDRLNQQQLDSVRAQNGSSTGPSSMGAPLMQQGMPASGSPPGGTPQ